MIRPREALKIRRVEHDPAEMQRVYDLGREEGVRRLDEVKRFLGEENCRRADLSGVLKEEHQS